MAAPRRGRGSGCCPEEVAVCSTGTIGDRIDMGGSGPGIDAAVAALSPAGGADFGRAICTTDRAPEGRGVPPARSGGGEVTDRRRRQGRRDDLARAMATMLAYVTVGAAVAADDLQAMTAAAAAASFNRISVDGQMSPSDTLLVMAGGDGAAPRRRRPRPARARPSRRSAAGWRSRW